MAAPILGIIPLHSLDISISIQPPAALFLGAVTTKTNVTTVIYCPANDCPFTALTPPHHTMSSLVTPDGSNGTQENGQERWQVAVTDAACCKARTQCASTGEVFHFPLTEVKYLLSIVGACTCLGCVYESPCSSFVVHCLGSIIIKSYHT